MDYQAYLGQWRNCMKDSQGIEAFEFLENNNELGVRIEGTRSGLVPGEWAVLSCKPYAADTNSTIPIAFQANYQSDTFDVYLQFNINKSLMILAILIDFKNAEKKSDVFIREFFSMEK